ncbi:hypothetical protein [Xenorhabdus sp. KK7.4]|uniref:hypothetical protein n=1 Tax=Xenorhabdus sp. KK7.4 TaxID=1851572 RepID=UPI00128FE87D|nr:hypothetical protein [Xenorhabdus sp. KK7.4]
MTKVELINYFHSAYPELSIDFNYIRGYSEDDLIKLKRVYDIEIQGEFLEFLTYMGCCSGGLFGDQPLRFYQERETITSEVLFQSRFWNELQRIQRFDLLTKKPFFISKENDNFYFLLTKSNNPDLVYFFDKKHDEIINTGLTFNEYLRGLINYNGIEIPLDQSGNLLII